MHTRNASLRTTEFEVQQKHKLYETRKNDQITEPTKPVYNGRGKRIYVNKGLLAEVSKKNRLGSNTVTLNAKLRGKLDRQNASP